MGILGNIFSKIFPKVHDTSAMGTTDTTPGGQPRPAQSPAQPAPHAAPTQTMGAAAAAAAAAQSVDVEKVLDDMAAKNPQKLNWKTSIVDLMKLVGMQSSLQERKDLADELGYTGDKNDSAAMNMWLHKQVMKKLAENGGKVPANLLD